MSIKHSAYTPTQSWQEVLSGRGSENTCVDELSVRRAFQVYCNNQLVWCAHFKSGVDIPVDEVNSRLFSTTTFLVALLFDTSAPQQPLAWYSCNIVIIESNLGFLLVELGPCSSKVAYLIQANMQSSD